MGHGADGGGLGGGGGARGVVVGYQAGKEKRCDGEQEGLDAVGW